MGNDKQPFLSDKLARHFHFALPKLHGNHNSKGVVASNLRTSNLKRQIYYGVTAGGSF
jgi:hypothetical protein